MRVFLASFVFLIAFSLPVRAESNTDLCEGHDWFQMRDKVAGGGASLLCKGAVDASFEHRSAAERELKTVIRKMPHSASSYRAHAHLVSMYHREGRNRKALEQLNQMLAEKSDAEDVKAIHPMFEVLARNPDQTVASSRPSTLRTETIEGNLFLPVTASGITGYYIADTGANISAMCESEARRLGLKLEETSTKLGDINGTGSTMHLAVVPDMWIGKTHLKNVAFTIYPDANEPFVDLPKGHKGVLGIPVLIALGAFRVDKDNRVDILPGPATTSNKGLPVAFDAQNPTIQMSLNGKKFIFTLDTGAERTELWPVFASAFPDLMRTGIKKDHKITGISGSATHESIELPAVHFSLGKDITLAPASVLANADVPGSEWAGGNLGFDLVSQLTPITFDFRAMQLIVEDR
jgi:predicted aspartyl protease